MTTPDLQALCLLATCFELLLPVTSETLPKPIGLPTPGNRSVFKPYRQRGRNQYRFKKPHFNSSFITTTMLSEEDEENLLLLWLPYVIFTIVLLSLIFMSFVRFHFQRGDQYRRRREEMEDKPVMNGIKPPMESTAMLEKGSDVGWDKYPTIAKTIPDHLSLFLQFSQTGEDDTPRKSALKKSESGQFYDSKRISSDEPSICSGGRYRRAYLSKMPALPEPSVGFVDKSSPRKSTLEIADLIPKAKNVAFTFNANGSMVDIRCAEEERSNTFRINEKSDINQNSLDYQSGVDYKSASLSSKGSRRKKLEYTKVQSLERHLPRQTRRSFNAPLSSMHSVDYPHYPYFTKYQTPIQETPSIHFTYNQPNKTYNVVKMVDAATSPGLALKSRLQSPYRTAPFDELSSAELG